MVIHEKVYHNLYKFGFNSRAQRFWIKMVFPDITINSDFKSIGNISDPTSVIVTARRGGDINFQVPNKSPLQADEVPSNFIPLPVASQRQARHPQRCLPLKMVVSEVARREGEEAQTVIQDSQMKEELNAEQIFTITNKQNFQLSTHLSPRKTNPVDKFRLRYLNSLNLKPYNLDNINCSHKKRRRGQNNSIHFLDESCKHASFYRKCSQEDVAKKRNMPLNNTPQCPINQFNNASINNKCTAISKEFNNRQNDIVSSQNITPMYSTFPSKNSQANSTQTLCTDTQQISSFENDIKTRVDPYSTPCMKSRFNNVYGSTQNTQISLEGKRTIVASNCRTSTDNETYLPEVEEELSQQSLNSQNDLTHIDKDITESLVLNSPSSPSRKWIETGVRDKMKRIPSHKMSEYDEIMLFFDKDNHEDCHDQDEEEDDDNDSDNNMDKNSSERNMVNGINDVNASFGDSNCEQYGKERMRYLSSYSKINTSDDVFIWEPKPPTFNAAENEKIKCENRVTIKEMINIDFEVAINHSIEDRQLRKYFNDELNSNLVYSNSKCNDCDMETVVPKLLTNLQEEVICSENESEISTSSHHSKKKSLLVPCLTDPDDDNYLASGESLTSEGE